MTFDLIMEKTRLRVRAGINALEVKIIDRCRNITHNADAQTYEIAFTRTGRVRRVRDTFHRLQY